MIRRVARQALRWALTKLEPPESEPVLTEAQIRAIAEREEQAQRIIEPLSYARPPASVVSIDALFDILTPEQAEKLVEKIIMRFGI